MTNAKTEDDDESSDEYDDEWDDTDAREDAEDNEARGQLKKIVPIFKDVEESINIFSRDDGKGVKSWIKEFESINYLIII